MLNRLLNPIRLNTSKIQVVHWTAIFLFLTYAIFYLSGLKDVPFHPDESTQIFMSSDVDIALSSFSDLFWSPEKAGDLRQHYREIDAPLTRYLIGFSRLLTHSTAIPVDWDWAKTWGDNRSAGALPTSDLLWLARLGNALFFLAGLILFFRTLQSIFNPYLALMACLIFALNPLILLHTRRAMAEPLLISLSILAIWVLLFQRDKVWLMGITVALAVNAKQTALALCLPVLFLILLPAGQQKKWSLFLTHGSQFLLSFLFIWFLLNPFTWSDPVHSIQDALIERQELVSQQTGMITSASPEKAIGSIPEKSAAMLGAVFFSQPMVADVSNYIHQTQKSETVYFSSPIHNLNVWPFISLLNFLLTISGLVFFLVNFIHKRIPLQKAALIMFSLTGYVIFIFFFINFPFQRYYLPLILFSSLFSAYAVFMPLNRFINKSSIVKN